MQTQPERAALGETVAPCSPFIFITCLSCQQRQQNSSPDQRHRWFSLWEVFLVEQFGFSSAPPNAQAASACLPLWAPQIQVSSSACLAAFPNHLHGSNAGCCATHASAPMLLGPSGLPGLYLLKMLGCSLLIPALQGCFVHKSNWGAAAMQNVPAPIRACARCIPPAVLQHLVL